MRQSFLFFFLAFSLLSVKVQAEGWLPELNIFGDGEEKGVTVWEAGQQYIRIVAQEESAVSENDHPKTLSASALKDALAAVKLEEVVGIFEEGVEEFSVFSKSDVVALSSGLTRAFERAKPTEDVIFVVIGKHKGLITKERKVIAGRAFFLDGKLNLIFGDLYRPEGGSQEQRHRNLAAGCGGCDDQDVRTNPYIVGKRSKERETEVVFAKLNGIEQGAYLGEVRSDWIILELDTILAFVEKEKNKLPPAMEREKARAKTEAAKLNLERRQMREEMARMRKEMGDISGSGTTGSNSLEQRLKTLQELKQKGLVTEDEYQLKRRQILSDI